MIPQFFPPIIFALFTALLFSAYCTAYLHHVAEEEKHNLKSPAGGAGW